jgi:hypothetical protein
MGTGTGEVEVESLLSVIWDVVRRRAKLDGGCHEDGCPSGGGLAVPALPPPPFLLLTRDRFQCFCRESFDPFDEMELCRIAVVGLSVAGVAEAAAGSS